MPSTEYSTGRQYHLDISPGDVAPYILLCGDPARAFRTALYFDSRFSFLKKILWGLYAVKFAGPAIVGALIRLFFADVFELHREFVTITGKYKGVPVSVIGSGIGTDNIEIAIIEATLCLPGEIKPTFIRIGSCAAIKEGVNVGDLVISKDAIIRENTSGFYLPPEVKRVRSTPVVAHALEAVAKYLGFTYRAGTTCSTSSFYAGQGREVPGFPINEETKRGNLFRLLLDQGVLNFEMETSLLFALAATSTRGLRAGSVCAVYAARWREDDFDAAQIREAERRCIETALDAVTVLTRIDLDDLQQIPLCQGREVF